MENSAIQWTDHTFNPWIGCTKVDELCTHCYAETLDRRRMSKTLDGGTPENPVSHWGKGAPRHRTGKGTWHDPIRWNAESGKAREAYDSEPTHFHLGDPGPRRPRVFSASLADWLDAEVAIEWLADFLDLVRQCTALDWQLLTKRPENWRPRLQEIQTLAAENHYPELEAFVAAWLAGNAPANVWFGVSAGTQKGIDKRIPILHTIPARVRFLSCEPMLEYVELYSALKVCASWPPEFRGWRDAPNSRVKWSRQALMPAGWRDAVNWVICGGESTNDPAITPRPLHPHWAQCLRDQCAAASVPFFFKQWGDWIPYNQGKAYMNGFSDTRLIGDGHVKASGWPVYRVGKHSAGDLLDGIQHHAFPK